MSLSDPAVEEPTFTAPGTGEAVTLTLEFRATITAQGGDVFADDVEVTIQPANVLTFLADPDGTGSRRLFAYRPYNHSIVELSGDVTSGGSVQSWSWSSDQKTIAFKGDLLSSGDDTLFAVQSDGTSRVQLSSNPVLGSEIERFAWSPNGERIAFWGDVGATGIDELFSVSPAGADLQLEAAGSVAGDQIRLPEWTPDSSRIVTLVESGNTGTYSLLSVIAGGGASTALHPPLVAGGSASNANITPSGDVVVFTADLAVDGDFELFRCDVDGSGFSTMNAPLVAGGDVSRVALSPDGQWVAYRADGETDNVFELYTIRIDGTAQQKVSPTPVAGGDVGTSFQWTSDSARIIFAGDLLTDSATEVFSVRPDGSGFASMTPPIAAGETHSGWNVSPNGEHLIVHVLDSSVYDFALSRVDGVGGAQILGRTDDPIFTAGDWTPDSSRFFTNLDHESIGEPRMYSALADGTDLVNLHGSLLNQVQIIDAQPSPDSRFLAYSSIESGEAGVRVYVVPIGGGPRLEVSPQGSAASPFLDFSWSRDSQWLFIEGDAEVDGESRIWTCRPTGADLRPVPLAMDPAGAMVGSTWSF